VTVSLTAQEEADLAVLEKLRAFVAETRGVHVRAVSYFAPPQVVCKDCSNWWPCATSRLADVTELLVEGADDMLRTHHPIYHKVVVHSRTRSLLARAAQAAGV
jgi:hypothetical protein